MTRHVPTELPHVVVVGAGISGLAAAERLAASAAVRVTVVERAPRLGGIVRTERVDGFVIEHGPDVMVAMKPAGRALAERLGIGARLQGTAVRGGYVFRRGRLRRLPEGLSGLMPTRLAPIATSGLLSPLGLLRLATEPLRRSAAHLADESVASFMGRRMGREMYERLCEPLLTGIFSGHGARLSMEATFPQLRAMEREHGSLLGAIRARQRAARQGAAEQGGARGAVGHASPFLSFPGGLQELVDALERALAESPRVTIRRGTDVARVRAGAVELADGETIACDAVVVATPAPVAARLLAGVDDALTTEIAAIEHGSTATIALAYAAADVPRALDGTGYVVPRTEGRPVLACTWVSSKHRGRAPEGAVLFRLFVGGAQHGDAVTRPDAALLAMCRAELHASLGVTAEPRLARITRWVGAMPQYHLGHPERVARIEAREAALGWLAVAGNAYRGVGVPDCIASGERAAARVLDAATAEGGRAGVGRATAVGAAP